MLKERFQDVLKFRIIPVVAIHDAENAGPLADALIEGGLPSAEITFRTEAALEAISCMAKRGDMLVGAGTVLKVEQARRAVDSGACFIVSPGFNPKVVQYCVENHIPVTPGTSTPTDIERAIDFGLDIVKFFPAEAFGGVKTLKAISAPFGMMRFIPTGGIGPHNVIAYLNLPNIPACGGSWMVKSDLISKGKFTEIVRLTRETMDLVTQAV
jgi:2-dehydro-3-deoxyphosphogluconate aldolase / (4S)-4-hydroxy-2-oxoglutarate aldolase